MPAAYPKEFRDDVVAVARKGDMPIAQVAKDFGITESCLRRWLAPDDGPRAGDGERGPASGCGVSVAGEPETGPVPTMTFPVVTDLARDGVPVKLSCRVLGFSRQAYYQWFADPVTDREWSGAHAANAVLQAHRDDPEFGYRFLADELRDQGLDVSDHQVLKACRLVHVRCCHSVRRGSGKRPGPPVHDDLVRREFRADRPTSCG